MMLDLTQTKMQDSLGGNSKTMIIANVSPSIWLVYLLLIDFLSFQLIQLVINVQWAFFFLIFFILYSCSCAAETLNTLKFAQRAKLIQNNVKVYLLPMLYGGIFLTSYFCLYIFLPSWCRLWLMKILQEMLLHCNTRYDC